MKFKQKSYDLNFGNIKIYQKITYNDNLLMYVFCLASFQIGLSRIIQEASISIGIPSLNKKGIHILDTELNSITFRTFLQAVKKRISSVLRTENVGKTSCNVVVSFEDINKYQSEHCDASFHILPTPSGVSIDVTYREGRYSTETLDAIMRSMLHSINECLKDFDISINDVLKINTEEQILINEYNSKNEYSVRHDITSRFLDAVQKYRNNVAIVENDQRMTYGEIDQTSNKLANYLTSKGVEKGHIVAILNGRTIETVMSMLALLKIGAAYAPIDAGYPKEKIGTLLNSSNIDYIISSRSSLHLIDKDYLHKVLLIDSENQEIFTYSDTFIHTEDMESLCYVIFTSGSTGVPKVAAVKNIGWSNLLYWFTDHYHINSYDNVYLISSISFDISQRSIFMALINGSTLHLYPDAIYDPKTINNYIFHNKISIINCAPSAFYPLIEEYSGYKKLQSLRCVFLGGEAISASRLVEWYRTEYCKAIISNVYGVAECSDVSSYYELCNFDKYISDSVPIGYPIYNSQLYIINSKGEYLPIGSVGEICIAGIGVGAGYINDSKLTQEKFVRLTDGLEVYLTGDMGRFTGNYIEYAGRKDHQVKIRGNRVELGDIENAIRQINFIKEVVVVINKSEIVVAYLEIIESEIDFEEDSQLISQVYHELRKKMPPYMIPDRLQIIETIPVNHNGKIDRLKLSSMEISTRDEVFEDITDSEKEITKIILGVLDVTSVNTDKNIFDQGMHSILVIRLVALINEQFSVNLAPIDIYLNNTIKKLSRRINSTQG